MGRAHGQQRTAEHHRDRNAAAGQHDALEFEVPENPARGRLHAEIAGKDGKNQSAGRHRVETEANLKQQRQQEWQGRQAAANTPPPAWRAGRSAFERLERDQGRWMLSARRIAIVPQASPKQRERSCGNRMPARPSNSIPKSRLRMAVPVRKKPAASNLRHSTN